MCDKIALKLRRVVEGEEMIAYIESGGKQYRVSKGDALDVEKLDADVGERVELGRVLAIVLDNGDLVLGSPTVEGAAVKARVVRHFKGKKILVFKYKSKVNYRKRRGHRQSLTRVIVEDVAFPA